MAIPGISEKKKPQKVFSPKTTIQKPARKA